MHLLQSHTRKTFNDDKILPESSENEETASTEETALTKETALTEETGVAEENSTDDIMPAPPLILPEATKNLLVRSYWWHR